MSVHAGFGKQNKKQTAISSLNLLSCTTPQALIGLKGRNELSCLLPADYQSI
jgi:hypothetical protein